MRARRRVVRAIAAAGLVAWAGCAGYEIRFGSRKANEADERAGAAAETPAGEESAWTYEQVFLAWQAGFREFQDRFERRRPSRGELEERFASVRGDLAGLARYLAAPEDREALARFVDRLDQLWARWDGLGNPNDFRALLVRLEGEISRALGPGTRASTPADPGRGAPPSEG